MVMRAHALFPSAKRAIVARPVAPRSHRNARSTSRTALIENVALARANFSSRGTVKFF